MEQKAPYSLPGILGLIFAVGVGAAVRIHDLGVASLWTDEIGAVLVCRQPLGDLISTIAVQDVSPPLFYTMLHFWLYGGDGELYLRMLPVIFSVASIFVTYLIGRRLFSEGVGIAAALFLALSPMEIHLAQNLRYYSLLCFLSAAAVYGYLRLKDGGKGLWFALPLLFGFYTHYYFLLVAFVIGIWFLVDLKKGEIPFWKFFVPILIALICFAPWIVAIAIQYDRGTFLFRPEVSLGALFLDLLTNITLGIGSEFSAVNVDPFSVWNALYALPVLGALLFGLLFERRQKATWLALLWLTAPILVVALISRFLNLYGHAYFVIILPALALLVGLGVSTFASVSKALTAPMLALVLIFPAISISQYFVNGGNAHESWRGLATWIQNHEKQGDALLVYDMSQSGSLMYYYKGALPVENILAGDPTTFDQEPAESVEKKLKELFAKYKRVFFLPHFQHMYEPAGYAKAFVDEHCIVDSNFRFMDSFGLDLRPCYTSRKNAFLDLYKTFGTKIDFTTENYHQAQIDGDLSDTGKPWMWMGSWARFYLSNPGTEMAVTVKIMAEPKYHKGKPIPLYLLIDGKPVKHFMIKEAGIHELRATLPAVQGELIEVGLYAKSTFNPQEFFEGSNASEKSVMVGLVALEIIDPDKE